MRVGVRVTERRGSVCRAAASAFDRYLLRAHARTLQQTHLSAEIVHDSIDVKNVQLIILKTLKNVKNVTKIKKNVCKRSKNVTYS